LFAQLEYEKPRWQSFAASYAIVSGAMLMMVVVTILTAPNLIRMTYEHIELIAPPLDQPKPYEAPKPKIAKVIPPVAPPKEVLEKIEPKIIVPQVVLPKKVEVAEVAPPKVVAPTKFDSSVLNKMPGPPVLRAVVTNVLGSSAAPTLPNNTPSAKVQTGGFGDPNGVPANPNAPHSRLGIASVGSFELPSGPGIGNGTGGANGKQGTIASAGFGNGVATGQGGGGRNSGAHVQNTAFGNAMPVAEAPSRPKTEDRSPITPVAVTSKPNPVYTDQARKQHVEGEVLLQVVFMASGQVQVLRVVRGLGYGLDESAVQAAQRVRFVPAQRNGQPVDSTATLHIVFQLS
jgi:TonB family protein